MYIPINETNVFIKNENVMLRYKNNNNIYNMISHKSKNMNAN